MSLMNFGGAIEALKAGERVAREGWNGKGMFLYLVTGTKVDSSMLRNEAAAQPISDETGSVTFGSHIDMFTAQKTVCVGWLASQTDMLANDWCVVGEPAKAPTGRLQVGSFPADAYFFSELPIGSRYQIYYREMPSLKWEAGDSETYEKMSDVSYSYLNNGGSLIGYITQDYIVKKIG